MFVGIVRSPGLLRPTTPMTVQTTVTRTSMTQCILPPLQTQFIYPDLLIFHFLVSQGNLLPSVCLPVSWPVRVCCPMFQCPINQEDCLPVVSLAHPLLVFQLPVSWPVQLSAIITLPFTWFQATKQITHAVQVQLPLLTPLLHQSLCKLMY